MAGDSALVRGVRFVMPGSREREDSGYSEDHADKGLRQGSIVAAPKVDDKGSMRGLLSKSPVWGPGGRFWGLGFRVASKEPAGVLKDGLAEEIPQCGGF